MNGSNAATNVAGLTVAKCVEALAGATGAAHHASGYVFVDASVETGYAVLLVPCTDIQTVSGTRRAQGKEGEAGFRPAEDFVQDRIPPLTDERMDRWGWPVHVAALAAEGYENMRIKLTGGLKKAEGDVKKPVKATKVLTRKIGTPTKGEQEANAKLADVAATQRMASAAPAVPAK